MLFHIFTTSIVPILLMAGVGFCVDRKFSVDLPTLSKLNFYVVGPAFLFTNLYESHLSVDSLHLLWVNLLILIGTFLLSVILIKGFSFDQSKGEALRNALLFNNCGNIGIPLIVFVYSNTPFVDGSGEAIYLQLALQGQIILFTLQNITTTSFGFYFAGRGRMTTMDALRLVFKMPLIYAAAAGLLCNIWNVELTHMFFYPAVQYFSQSLVMIALFTLGVQLARTPFAFFTRDISIAVIGRLFGGPLVAYLCIILYSWLVAPFSPVINQVLFFSAAVPSGVMTALIAAEMKNHPHYATQVVMVSTLLSCVTLPAFIWLSYILFPM